MAARSETSVLVVGPSGSGRRHIARAIHYHADPNTTGRLVPLDGELLEAELLELTITALIGSKDEIDPHDTTTLVLSGTDQIDAAAQNMLAAILHDSRPGFRVIATTQRPLSELAAAGDYREDLACALSTLIVQIPPLKERIEDIPLLAQAFLERINAEDGKQCSGFSPEALDQLIAHPWPGELDELAATVAQAHRAAAGPSVSAAELPRRLHLAASAAARQPKVEETIVLEEFLGEIERELIQRALAQAKGNKTRAAQLLGLTRPRLYRRLVQLGLADNDP